MINGSMKVAISLTGILLWLARVHIPSDPWAMINGAIKRRGAYITWLILWRARVHIPFGSCDLQCHLLFSEISRFFLFALSRIPRLRRLLPVLWDFHLPAVCYRVPALTCRSIRVTQQNFPSRVLPGSPYVVLSRVVLLPLLAGDLCRRSCST